MSLAIEAGMPRGGIFRGLHKNMTVQVLGAIGLGVVLGHLDPSLAVTMKPLGDLFIRLIKMAIGPIIFLTVVTGISSIGDMKKVGRVGGKALLYFEVVTTIALAIGLLVVNLLKPGAGINAQPSAQTAAEMAKYAPAGHQAHGFFDFVLNIVPDNVLAAFAKGDLMQIVLFSVLFGVALTMLGETGKPVEALLDKIGKAFFGIIHLVMRLAPIGAFGAMAFTVGKYGIGSVASLGKLMLCVYLTMGLFIFGVLGSIARCYGFSLLKLLQYIREELVIVLGTSTTESVLPQMMEKMERLGCSKTVVGLVLPTGYSFNLDGAAIYLSMATLFIAQAYNVDLDLWQQIGILALLMITSKGGAGVVGSAFVVLGGTLAATHTLPIEGLALLLGVDRFINEGRALTNLIGNAVATLAVAKMEREFDETQALAEYREYFEEPRLARI